MNQKNSFYMKRIIRIAVVAACVAVFSVSAHAQTNVKDVLDKAVKVISSSDVQDVIEAVTGFDISKYLITDITGTWSYISMETKVVKDGDDVESTLAGIAGSAAVNASNKKLDKLLAKAGIVEGSMEITFNSDSTFTHKIKNTSVSGTYSLNKDRQLTLNYGTTIKFGTLIGTIDKEGDNLGILFPADKFLTVMSKLSSIKQFSYLGKVVSKYDGMKVGVKLTKI